MDPVVIISIVSALTPLILAMFPGLNQFFKLLPNSFFEAIVRVKGGRITWDVPVAQRREQLNMERQALAAFAARPDTPEGQRFAQVTTELNELPLPNGPLAELLKNPVVLIAIGVGVLFFVTNKGGCKPVVNPPQASVPALVTK
jgi:hypothetical protein